MKVHGFVKSKLIFAIVLLTVHVSESLSEICFYHSSNEAYIQCGDITVNRVSKQEELLKIVKIQLGWNTTLPILKYGLFNVLPRLTSLILNNANIEEIDSQTFYNMDQLQELNLYNNKLLKIKLHTFNYLSHLKILDLGQNQLDFIDDYAFTNLIHLEQLILRWNNLNNVSKATFKGLMALKVLDLKWNRLTTLEPNTLNKLKLLKNIDLSFNGISNIPPGLFVNQENLKKLNLQSNYIRNIPDELFKNTVSLEILDVSNNKITHLEETVFKNTVLEVLNFNRNRITAVNATKLLYNAEYLDELYFDFNPWNCNSLEDLVRELRQSFVHFGRGTRFNSKNVEGIGCRN